MSSGNPVRPPPPPSHILETCLYVRDMTVSTTFYSDVLGLTPKISSPRLTMFPLGDTTLILFQLGLTESDSVSREGTVPGHGPDKKTVAALLNATNPSKDGALESDGSDTTTLHTHYCLAVSSGDQVDAWETYLKAKDVKLRGTMNWARGGKSVYFEDPDGHVGEIGSRGIWEHW